MANSLLSKDQISNIEPGWSHPVLPGHAVQGCLLLTRSDFVNPPQSSEMFVWKPMEDIVGIHDIRFKYYQQDNTYHIYKTYGHLNNDDKWIEDVYDIGHFNGITDEVREHLEMLKYLEYKFTFTGNVYKIVGLLKDGVEETILEIQIPTLSQFEQEVQDRKDADAVLQDHINTERTDRQAADSVLENRIHDEEVTRLAADNKLTSDLATETQNRIDGDNTLQNNITEEANTRKSEDDNIKADVTQKVELAMQYYVSALSQLQQEIGERTAADTQLQTKITDETTNRTNANNLINQTMQSNYNTLNAKIDSVSGAAVHTEVVETRPDTPTNNTMYYVGKDGNYQVWLYSNDTWYDMGSTQIDLTPYQTKAQAKIEHDELEAKITTSAGDITTVTDNVTNLTTQLGTLTTTVNNVGVQAETNKNNIETNKQSIAKNTTDIGTNKTNISTNATNITTNKNNITANTTAISNLTTTVAKQKPVAGDLIKVTEATTGTTIAVTGTSEEWTFTLSDNTTVKRKIRYF